MAKICSTCMYWQESKPYRGRAWGECRRNAPIVAAMYHAKWPRTNDVDWCGQYTMAASK